MAALIAGMLPLAAQAVAPMRLAVSEMQDNGTAVRLQVRAPAGMEPDLGWSGNSQPGPYRLVLAWRGANLELEKPLPDLPWGGRGPVQSMAVQNTDGGTRLELQLSRAVEPSLHRAGDAWVLQLTPEGRPGAIDPAPIRPLVESKPENTAPPAQQVAYAVPRPASPPRPKQTAARPELLLLDLSVNGERKPDVVQAEQWPDGKLLLAAVGWAGARLAVPGESRALTDGTPAYQLDTVAGLTYRIDRGNLSLEINAPASAFVGSRLGPQGSLAAPPPRPAPGVMLNYDLSLARGGNGATSSGATLEAVAFNSFGNVVASALASDDGQQRRLARLDTYWRYDMPERMETLVVGDTVGVGGGWSRPARYAGVRWGRDFGMRPGFVTMPQLSLSGEAALPSTVDVLVNNARRISQTVAPGPFDLSNVPVVTGAGEVNLVVRDLLGRETLVKQSYYASPRLLAPDLMDFSAEAGWLRTGYGQGSHYGEAFAAGTLRRGLTQSLTGEARVELQPDRRAAGVELAGLLGNWAVARGALAFSSGDSQGASEQGHLLQLGVERSTATAGGALQYEHASRGFAPFGEATGASAALQRSRDRWLASAGGALWGSVTGGISFVRQTRWDGDKLSSIGLSLGVPVGPRASLSLSLQRRLDGDRAWTAGVNLTVPLDNGVYTSARVERDTEGKLVASVSASQNPPAGPGLGWRAEASSQESQRARAGVQFNTQHAELAMDVAADAQGQIAARAGARGTVGMLAGLPFASRPVGEGSFAVVEVEGLADVPVKRSNQVVAHTDSRGRAFVAGLLPWQKNQIELDPTDLPLDAQVQDLTQDVTPYARGGALVKFALRRTRQALVVLTQADGEPVPVGARVSLGATGPEFVVGRRGEAWLTDLAQERQTLHVSWPRGGCTLTVDVPVMEDGMPARIGPVACAGGRQ
ncbi:MAG TPA: fimbria/pilus outer membrane usher protein [Ramlibacter sp.]|nr:fimbria/pilus outer membrane usher protein [Ramlibacter sp.]